MRRDADTPNKDTERLEWMMRQVSCDDLGIHPPFGLNAEQHFQEFRKGIDKKIASEKRRTKP